MDILDILIAKALSPQGQIETAAAQAVKAASDASTAVTRITGIEDQVDAALDAVTGMLADLAEIDLGLNEEQVDAEIKKLSLSLTSSTSASLISKGLQVTYPDGDTAAIQNVIKYYQQTGNNTDGTMTQKAITDAINNSSSSGGGGSVEFPTSDAGKMTVINSDGNLAASQLKEEDLFYSLVVNEIYSDNNVIGTVIDYENKETRPYSKNGTVTFNNFRCNVNDNGQIVAKSTEGNYSEDGSNGNVMTAINKFYYYRAPIAIGQNNAIQKEVILISDQPKYGFKLHPAFIDKNGEEIDYILYSTFEGGLYNISNSQVNINGDTNATTNLSSYKLVSYGGVVPTTNLTITAASQIAENNNNTTTNGVWSITNIKAESALQMLFIALKHTLNAQATIGSGVVNIPISGNTTAKYASFTGSTHNMEERATSTINRAAGSNIEQTAADRVSVNWMGIENLWGNVQRMIRGITVENQYYQIAGVNTNLSAPTISGWINNFGYNATYDWAFFPVIAGNNATNVAPVGDILYTVTNTENTEYQVALGGSWASTDNAGLFFTATDQVSGYSFRNLGARLLYTPVKDSTTYTYNMENYINGGE